MSSNTCSICLCDSQTVVRCPISPSTHMYCKGCFGEGIVGRCGAHHSSYWDRNGGKLACPLCDGCFDERTVFENSSPKEWDIYFKAVCDYRVAREVKAREERDSQTTTTTREEIEVKIHVDHIRENIFTLKCPKCAAPFAEFDGCLALSCGSCGTGFCALCVNTSNTGEVITTSAQAHAHVTKCKYNPCKPSYYATRHQFVKARNGRYKDLVDERLIAISDVKIRLGVSKTILKDLKDLGVDAKVVSGIIKKNGEHEPAVTRPLVAPRSARLAERVLEADARRREAEANRREAEANRREVEARRRDAEVWRREAEARRREAGARGEAVANEQEAIAMVADFIAREQAEATVVDDAEEGGGGGGGGAADGRRAEPPVVGPFHFGRAPVQLRANARPRQYCEGRGCYKIAEFTFPDSGKVKCFKCTKEILGMGKNGRRSACIKAGAVAIDA